MDKSVGKAAASTEAQANVVTTQTTSQPAQ
jgi:hypothetical protein